VDEHGFRLQAGRNAVLDVLMQGQRVWSLYALQDTQPTDDGARLATWPSALARLLDGVVDVRIELHAERRVLHADSYTWGSGLGRVALVDSAGRPLSVDKAGRLTPSFARRTAEDLTPLLDYVEAVLQHLHELGVRAFPAYGTLLGAVRDGRLIPHDTDADLGYVSERDTPFDVIRESFDIQRQLVRRGFRTRRYSGLAFKVDVVEADGFIRGLDVFGGFFSQGSLYLMGVVGVPFRQEWIYPLGSTTLEGRRLPAPREPERLLEAMYGTGWQVPDPAFHHEPVRETSDRLNAWFRGIRVRRALWDTYHREVSPAEQGLSSLGRLVHEREGVPSHLVDVGAGRGGDALWFARRGSHAVAYDYSDVAMNTLGSTARREGLDLEPRRLNLLELRFVLSEGGRLARDPRQPVVLADDVIGATTATGRRNFWRFASMALRHGGTLYVEATLRGGGRSSAGDLVKPLPPDLVNHELREAGLDIILHAVRDDENGEPGAPARRVGRWVVGWNR
jgi:hypothetical protein